MKIIKTFITSILFIICFTFNAKTEEFFFEGEEIQILENGNRLISDKGVVVTTQDNLILTANKLDYDKEKSILLLSGNVVIDDPNNNIKIETKNIIYEKKDEKIYTKNETSINVENKYYINSQNIIYEKNLKTLSANEKVSIIDNYRNNISAEKFLFLIDKKILKAKNVSTKDSENNISNFKSFFGNLEKDEFFGKDIEVYFSKETFGNNKNDPRLKGNIFESNTDKLIVSKGIFTTCKKRDGCPPWTLKADKVVHDKKNKIINYHNAWLEVYDKPIIYFPRFFHPDPTVKRQSGFLIPKFTDTSNTGTSLQIPYFKVLAENKDLTFTPTIFTNRELILQNEYRREEKNYSHIMDLSFFTSALADKEQESNTHFFSNTKFDLEDGLFDETMLEINLEKVSNDTYLKKYDINSSLIRDVNLLHSFLNYDSYSENSYLSFNIETYENLSKNKSDRYEFIFPNVKFVKNLEETYYLQGSLNFSSEIYQKQYDTNKYDQFLNNTLSFNSAEKYEENGLVKNLNFTLINPNDRSITGSDNKSETSNRLLSQLKYSLSYPLKKQSEIYDNIFNPTLSYRFSPNKTKNISSADRVLNVSNIHSLNRVTSEVEGGQSLTFGLNYKKMNKSGTEKIGFNLAQVINEKNNYDLPKKSTLNKKYSDVFGSLRINAFENLNFEYNFMVDEGFSKANSNSIKSTLSINNFITSFEYLEESKLMGSKHYISNETTYKFDSNNSIAFKTRENKEINLTEFYNLVYQYENDCLRAALEYNKSYYSDADIRPEEEIFFTLTILPYTSLNTTNLK